MDKYNIINILGYGMEGIVLLVEKDNKKYALKISFIYDVKKAKFILNNELNFQSSVVNNCDCDCDCFIKLYEYKLLYNCSISNDKHIMKLIENEKEKIPKKLMYKILENNICIKKIYDLVDGSLYQILSTLDKKQIFSAIIQIAQCIHILEKNNFIHADIRNNKNIAFIKTNKEFIKIENYDIPTFGYCWKLIDYDRVRKINDNFKSQDFMYEFLNIFLFCFLLGNINIKSTEFYDKNKLSIRMMGSQKFEKESIYKDTTKKINRIINKIIKLNVPPIIGNGLFIYYYPINYGKWLLKDNKELYTDYKNIYLNKKNTFENLQNLNISFKLMKKIIKHKNNTKKLIKIFLSIIEN